MPYVCVKTTPARLLHAPNPSRFVVVDPPGGATKKEGLKTSTMAATSRAVPVAYGRFAGLTARKIGQSQRRVIGSPAYFQRMGVPRTPADLAKHQAVVYDQAGGGTARALPRGGAQD